MAWGSGHGLEPLGLPALREAVARRHTAAGLMTEAGQIHITSGAHHAIGVTIDALVAPGEAVVVDELNYPGLFDLLDHHRARTVGLGSDGAGPDPHALDRRLRAERPPVVFLQGGVVNPTGIVIGPARRRALAEVFDRHPGTVVVEDRTLVGLAFGSPPQPELATLCRRAPVITVESISKIALAGLRVGWLRAPVTLTERLAQSRITTDLGTSVASQILTLQLLDRLDDVAATRRATLEVIVRHATSRLRAELPDWSFEEPQGSSGIWVRLPISDSVPYTQVALRHGVQVAPGHVQVAGGDASPFLRICVDRTQPFVDEGLDRLGRAWDEFAARPRASA
jgi:DNA-binding transcriptional MocR family regulator